MGGGFIVIVIVVLVVLFLTAAREKAANEAWKQIASRLGLHYQQKGTFGERRLAGNVEGFRVTVRTERVRRGKSRKTYTCYEVHYPSLGLGLELARESSLSAIGKFFGKRDTEIGDPHFDREIRVATKSRDRLIEFLTPVRKAAILRTLSLHGTCEVNDVGIVCRRRGLTVDSRDLKQTLRMFVELAMVLTGTRTAEPEELEPIPVPPAEEWLESSDDLELLAYEELFPIAAEEGEELERFDEPEETLAPVLELEPLPEPELEPIAEPGPVPDPQPTLLAAPEQEAAPEREAAPEPDADRAPALSIGSIVAELFPEDPTTRVTAEDFEKRCLDRRVRGSGRLHRVEKYYSDRFFGSKPGLRVTLIVRETSTSGFGVLAVQAVVQLDGEEEELLQVCLGETVTFEGRLVHCDPYLRNLVVADAELR